MTTITKAACCLHNYLKISEARNATSNRPYCPSGYADHEDGDGNLIPGDWRLETADAIRDIGRVGSNTYSQSAADLRDTMMSYFTSSAGVVPWQINDVRSSGRS